MKLDIFPTYINTSNSETSVILYRTPINGRRRTIILNNSDSLFDFRLKVYKNTLRDLNRQTLVYPFILVLFGFFLKAYIKRKRTLTLYRQKLDIYKQNFIEFDYQEKKEFLLSILFFKSYRLSLSMYYHNTEIFAYLKSFLNSYDLDVLNDIVECYDREFHKFLKEELDIPYVTVWKKENGKAFYKDIKFSKYHKNLDNSQVIESIKKFDYYGFSMPFILRREIKKHLEFILNN